MTFRSDNAGQPLHPPWSSSSIKRWMIIFLLILELSHSFLFINFMLDPKWQEWTWWCDSRTWLILTWTLDCCLVVTWARWCLPISQRRSKFDLLRDWGDGEISGSVMKRTLLSFDRSLNRKILKRKKPSDAEQCETLWFGWYWEWISKLPQSRSWSCWKYRWLTCSLECSLRASSLLKASISSDLETSTSKFRRLLKREQVDSWLRQ